MPLAPTKMAIFILLLIAIPLAANQFNSRLNPPPKPAVRLSELTDHPITEPHPSQSPTAVADLENVLGAQTAAVPSSPLPTPDVQVSFGPSLSLTANFEGRPANKNSGQLFVGIAPGPVSNNPQYLLSYTINLPDSGQYTGLSLAGLSYGTTYTAYLKGPAQLVSAQTFTATVNGVSLNNGLPILLSSGDLNSDNVVDQMDYVIASAALGSSANYGKWNPIADLNGDGVINNYDITILKKNLGKTGSSGPWYSKVVDLKPTASQNIGGASSAAEASMSSGYWLWVPSTR